jgi:hypothetical protein
LTAERIVIVAGGHGLGVAMDVYTKATTEARAETARQLGEAVLVDGMVNVVECNAGFSKASKLLIPERRRDSNSCLQLGKCNSTLNYSGQRLSAVSHTMNIIRFDLAGYTGYRISSSAHPGSDAGWLFIKTMRRVFGNGRFGLNALA